MIHQFVTVTFRAGGFPYTYHNEGEPVAIGDVVKVPGRVSEGGWQRATVVSLPDCEPPFATKPILGKAPEEEGRPDGPVEIDRPAEPRFDRQPRLFDDTDQHVEALSRRRR